MSNTPNAKPSGAEQAHDYLARADKLAEVADALKPCCAIPVRYENRDNAYTSEERAHGEAAVRAAIKHYDVIVEAARTLDCDAALWTHVIMNALRSGVGGEGWDPVCPPHFWEPFEWSKTMPHWSRISFLDQVRLWETAYREKVNAAPRGTSAIPNLAGLTRDPGLTAILEHRWTEVHRCLNSGAHLAALIMMGTVLEGVLLAVARRNAGIAKASDTGKKQTKDIEHWGLGVLMDVAAECRWIKKDRLDFGDKLREYRNIVHPGNHLKAGGVVPDKHTCEVCRSIVQGATEDVTTYLKI